MKKYKKIGLFCAKASFILLIATFALIPAEFLLMPKPANAETCYSQPGGGGAYECYDPSTSPYPPPGGDFDPLPPETGIPIEPDILQGNINNPQVDAVLNGPTSSGGGGVVGGIKQGVQSAASCFSSAKAVRLVQEASIKTNRSYFTDIHVTEPNVNARAGINGSTPFDSNAYCVLNAIIRYVVSAFLSWMQNGFNGSPGFMNDPKQFLTDLKDKGLSEFTKNLQNDPNVPPEFKRFAISSLLSGYKSSSGSGGGNSSSGNGISRLMDGNMGPSDFFLSQALPQMQRSMDEQIGNIQDQLDRGSGFFDIKEPGKKTTVTDSSGNTKDKTTNAKTVTPGSISQNSTANKTEAEWNRLLDAKDANAIVSELIKTIMTIASKLLSSALK